MLTPPGGGPPRPPHAHSLPPPMVTADEYANFDAATKRQIAAHIGGAEAVTRRRGYRREGRDDDEDAAAADDAASSRGQAGPTMTRSGDVIQQTPFVSRSRIYAFVVDETGQPIELGSGRFAKAYLGEERWVESKTTMRRPVAIKCLQRGVSGEDQMRFQMEKEILERVQ